MIKVEELEYFNPFEPVERQFKHLPHSRILACNLSVQQRVFLYMAYCKNVEEDEALTFVYEEDTLDDAHKSMKQEYRSMHNNRFNHFCGLQFTKKDKIELNNRIKKVKAKVKNKSFSDIVLMFELYNNMENTSQKIFKDWNKVFKFNNKTEIFNFQGCIGLLLLNNFCFHYQKEQISQCVLYAMLLTNLFKYSPIAHKLEIESLEELNEGREKTKKTSKTNATNAHQKAYKGKTVTEREYVFKEAQNLMNGRDKESFYHKDGRINMSKLVKEIQNKRVREEKEIKTEKSYIEWLTNEEYIKQHGTWHN